MSRETQRDMDEESREQRSAAPASATAPTPAAAPKRSERTPPRQFLREVRQELRRVAWPSRKEVASYSTVVLFAVVLVTLYVFGLDQAFGKLVFGIFQ